MNVQSQQIFEGLWEEILPRSAELVGKRVRVIVESPAKPPEPDGYLRWRELFAQWIDGHPRTVVVADDSRDSIYSGEADDTR